MLKRLVVLVAIAALLLGACNPDPGQTSSETLPPVTSLPPVTTTTATTTTTTTTTSTLPPTFDVTVTVTGPDDTALTAATVIVGTASKVTDDTGIVSFSGIAAAPIEVTRPGWMPVSEPWPGTDTELAVQLEPRIVRGLRVSSYVASEPDMFAELLEFAANSTVNTLVFDTKDETSHVLYESESEFAASIGSIRPMYDPLELVAAAKAAGLYTITRIVTFEDSIWVGERPEHKLAGYWVDPTNREGWEYPLQLAVEACEIGFDEIQFDYVRFPAGQTAAAAQARKPTTQEERTTAIRDFLIEARNQLHPLGCAISADIFAIVLSSENDQGIGQMPEALSGVLDAVSPMIYPSHYSDGWLGFPEPNDHPTAVVADALDSGMPRLSGNTIMRPWLQAFYYDGPQVLAEIAEAESRGVGWILWNAGGFYAQSWLPPLGE